MGKDNNGENKLTNRTQDTPHGPHVYPGHRSASCPFGAVTATKAQPHSGTVHSLVQHYDQMKTAEVPYAADAEVSLSFDELQVDRKRKSPNPISPPRQSSTTHGAS